MWIIALVSFLIGLGCIDYNMNNEAKHNILLGFIGFILALPIPWIIIFEFYC